MQVREVKVERSGAWDKKRGRSQEVMTRKEEGVWRLGQLQRKESGGWNKKKKESGGWDKKRGRSLEAGQEKMKESGGWDKKRRMILEAGTRKEE
jgi:hypothetical protein